MSKMRSIEIDLDVHKCIELARRDFAESDNDVLRRLLGVDGGEAALIACAQSGVAWSGKGVTLPHGTRARMEYNGRAHRGVIENGEWVIGESRFKSPSAAASGVARTRAGTSPSLDGWIYWSVKRPDDTKWVLLNSLREEFREDAKASILA
jgi:hypothetical protein